LGTCPPHNGYRTLRDQDTSVARHCQLVIRTVWQCCRTVRKTVWQNSRTARTLRHIRSVLVRKCLYTLVASQMTPMSMTPTAMHGVLVVTLSVRSQQHRTQYNCAMVQQTDKSKPLATCLQQLCVAYGTSSGLTYSASAAAACAETTVCKIGCKFACGYMEIRKKQIQILFLMTDSVANGLCDRSSLFVRPSVHFMCVRCESFELTDL